MGPMLLKVTGGDPVLFSAALMWCLDSKDFNQLMNLCKKASKKYEEIYK